MGSGSKFQIDLMTRSFGVGFYVSKFPHTVSITITLIFVSIYIGFGKGYDE